MTVVAEVQSRSARRRGALPRVAAWLSIAVFTSLAVFGIAIAGGSPTVTDVLQILAFASFVVVGAVLIDQRPDSRIGWLCSAIGLGSAAAATAQVYSAFGLTHPGTPGTEVAAWLTAWLWIPTVGLAFSFLPLLFPDGRLPSRRWWPLAWLAAIDLVLLSISFALAENAGFGDIPNPFAVPGWEPALEVLQKVAAGLTILVGLACAASLIARYRHALPDERRQLKWVTAAFAVFAVSLAVAIPLPQFDTFAFTIPLLPLSVGIAVLRYRLYDIDLIINRALVYIPLTAILGGLYAAGVTFFQKAFVAVTGDRSDAAVVITTLILAGTFTPVRKTLDAAVDRRFKPPPAPRVDVPASAATQVPAAGPADPTLKAIGPDDAALEARMEMVAEQVVRRILRESAGSDPADPPAGERSEP